jgi:hypothetical protein
MSLNNSRIPEDLHLANSNELEVKDISYVKKSTSHLDVHHETKRDFTFPIVNFPFTSNNIPAAPIYGVYISQLVRFSNLVPNAMIFGTEYSH